jgi:ribosome biogenesis GTPase
VHALLPRRSCFVRKEAGARTEAQVLAANVDVAFLMAGLDRDYNLRRLERYLILAWDSGADPVIVLNKADLCAEVAARVAQVEGIACGAPAYPVSARAGTGLEPLRGHLGPGRTGVVLGSSGVGKSTLINRLAGRPLQAVGALRAGDGKGRHTTTHRELVLLPGGGMLIDSPGMREIQLWVDEDGLKDIFGEIEDLARGCRFRDCRHEQEPGCAVREALRDGRLEEERLVSYQKMQRELRHLAARQDEKARLQEKERGKRLSRWARQHYKNQ